MPVIYHEPSLYYPDQAQTPIKLNLQAMLQLALVGQQDLFPFTQSGKATAYDVSFFKNNFDIIIQEGSCWRGGLYFIAKNTSVSMLYIFSCLQKPLSDLAKLFCSALERAYTAYLLDLIPVSEWSKVSSEIFSQLALLQLPQDFLSSLKSPGLFMETSQSIGRYIYAYFQNL
jgi:hypothetical protein